MSSGKPNHTFGLSLQQLVTTEKRSQGKFKGQARGRKLAFNPCCHRNYWRVWRSGDKDQGWQSLWHVGSGAAELFQYIHSVLWATHLLVLCTNKQLLIQSLSNSSSLSSRVWGFKVQHRVTTATQDCSHPQHFLFSFGRIQLLSCEEKTAIKCLCVCVCMYEWVCVFASACTNMQKISGKPGDGVFSLNEFHMLNYMVNGTSPPPFPGIIRVHLLFPVQFGWDNKSPLNTEGIRDDTDRERHSISQPHYSVYRSSMEITPVVR